MKHKSKIKHDYHILDKDIQPNKKNSKIYLAGAALILASIISYYNSFSGVFLYDDIPSIVINPYIRVLWPLSKAMSWPLMNSGSTVSGRPILSLSFALNYKLLGQSAWGYHLVNLIIHLCSGLLLFGIIRRTLCGSRLADRYKNQATALAFAVSLIWLVHPLQTESITYIVQRAESLMGMFFLLTLYCAIRSFNANKSWPWKSIAVVFCALGMGTKEVMVAAPVIVLLYDYIFVEQSFKSLFTARKGFYMALAGTWIISIVLIISTTDMISRDIATTNPIDYLSLQPVSILNYIRLAFWPHPLIMSYDSISVGPAINITILVVVVLMLIGTAWLIYRKKPLGFAGGWFFLILAPSSSFVPTMQLMEEHRMYLPLVAIIAVAVIGMTNFLNWINKNVTKIFALLVLISITAIFIFLTISRNSEYHDDIHFWTKDIERRPQATCARYNLGVKYKKMHKLEEAIKLFKQVLELNPKLMIAHYQLGNMLMEQGQIKESEQYFENCLAIKPNQPDVLTSLGIVLMQQGKLEQAKEKFQQAFKIDPHFFEAASNLGVLLSRQNKLDEAEKMHLRALELRPNYADSHFNLAEVLELQGDYLQAVYHYQKAFELNPKDLMTIDRLAWLLAVSPDEQIRDGQKAMELAQMVCKSTGYKVPETMTTLAAAYAQVGKFNEAVTVAQKAIQLAISGNRSADKISKIENQLELYKKSKPFYLKSNFNVNDANSMINSPN